MPTNYYYSRFQINVNDALCVPCYDDLKIAFNFKQKCIQTDLLRKTKEKELAVNGTILISTHLLFACKNYLIRISLDNHNATKESSISKACTELEPLHSTVPSDDEHESASVVKSEEVASNSRLIENDCDDGELLSLLEFSDGQNNDADISETETIRPDVISKPPPTETFTCNECGRTFNRSANLRRHQRMIHFVNDAPARITRKRTTKLLPSKTDSSALSETALTEMQCEFCYRTFSTEKERQLHEVVHKTEDKPYRYADNFI